MANETSYLTIIHPPTRTITASAIQAITKGDFVKATANNDAVGTTGTLGGYTPDDVHVAICDAANDNQKCIGIALEAAATAGDNIAVALDGVFVVKSATAITAGVAVAAGSSANKNHSVEGISDGGEEYQIGRALTSASASGKYLVVALNTP